MRYLTDSALPITDIAAKIGFSETSVFSRRCKEWFGTSPSQIRRNAKQTGQPATLEDYSAADRAELLHRIRELELEVERLRNALET
ncbi:helix-turn-helix domain-containing protein [Sphingobium sp. DEHP117]|uniref:helix-turn-helix domain-containing protein n=1 Tax=Sphingobium sp. DEHP117 TaxID=2993436 RepID=UPI00359F3E87